MTAPITDLALLLRALAPRLNPGTYAYCVVPHGTDVSALAPVAMVAEAEGVTLVLREEEAEAAGVPVRFRAAWITLTVPSALDAVGLTAAFASALARAGVGCNVVAGAHHDHLFVPVAQAETAMAALRALQGAAPPSTPGVEITLDPARIDVEAAHAFLRTIYWAQDIPLEVLRRAIAHSLCVAALDEGRQVGFARLITDRATFAYLADVYVLPGHRGRGISRQMLAALFGHPDVQGLRRAMLATRDAHGLYEKFGFTPLAAPARFMERHDPMVYQGARGDA